MTSGTKKKRSDDKLSVRIIQEAQNDIEVSFGNLQGSQDGLTEDEAARRLAEVGQNEVAQNHPPSAPVQFLLSFKNPFIGVLTFLGLISAITDIWLPWRHGEATDPAAVIVIVTMVFLSALLRFWQEYRSNKAADALRAMVRNKATVLRRDQEASQPRVSEIPMSHVVPGDIVHLSAGDMIPADVRLIDSRDLFVSQSVLTGEALPIEKYDTMGAVSQKSAGLGKAMVSTDLLDLPNAGFMGTNVVSGTASALVVATGATTYFGSLARNVVGSRAQTAFDRGVNSVSWLLVRFMLVMVPIVFLINGLTKGNWMEALLFSVAVAVGLTPEMLPMIVSSNLARGAIAMSRRKVVVKRLNAIQNFGAMDVLCTDKTGTLTQEHIILERHVDVSDQTSDEVLKLGWLNSYHQSGMHNILDQAILKFGEEHRELVDAGIFAKVDEVPFDFQRRRLSVVIKGPDATHKVICKGAVEEVLSVSSWVREKGQIVALDDLRRNKLKELTRAYNEDGFRVLGVATRSIDTGDRRKCYGADIEKGLVLEGFLTLLDPPKDSARSAIKALNDKGVTVKVLSGDNAIVCAKICREVGLDPGTPLLGSDIECMSDEDLRARAEKAVVFSKLAPLQKSRVLKALQANGHTVGFLGDGINDAPALRDSDVGISVDTAADIAKETADIILLEKSLMVLEEGVVTGRETFGNIMKYLCMTASSNFGNVFSVLVASAFIPFLPMLALHLLIQNLLYDISQLTLPWDRVDKELLAVPGKWDAKNIGRFMIWLGPTSSIFDMVTFAVMWVVFSANSPEVQSLFQSGWFVEGLLSQTLVVHMLRTRKVPFIQSTAALPVLLTTVTIMAIGIYVPFSPLGAWVGLEPLPWSYFPWLVGILLSYCLVAQSTKWIYIRRFGRWT